MLILDNSNERKQQWNQSYCRGGNICFYPNEEIIRFVNKYVRKREADNTFRNVMNLGGGQYGIILKVWIWDVA